MSDDEARGPADSAYSVLLQLRPLYQASEQAVAGALRARKLVMLTDVRGVLDGERRFLSTLTDEEARALIAEGAVTGGMIPKIETCLAAVAQGVGAAVILDGRVPHAILLELFTEHGIGTQILAARR